MEETEKNEDFAGDLSQFDDEFEKTEAAPPNEFVKIPNGKYQVVVDKVRLDRAQNSGALMLKWELIIIGGKYIGRRLFRNNMIATPENFSWLKRDLINSGVEIKKASELPGQLNNLLNILLEVAVRNTKKNDQENVNVYITKKLKIELPEAYIRHMESKDDFNAEDIEAGKLKF